MDSSSYCGSINTSTKRDTCYMFFVSNHDYSICEKIAQPYIQKSCLSLRQINQLMGNSTMPTGYSVYEIPGSSSLPENETVIATAEDNQTNPAS